MPKKQRQDGGKRLVRGVAPTAVPTVNSESSSLSAALAEFRMMVKGQELQLQNMQREFEMRLKSQVCFYYCHEPVSDIVFECI